jgi:hypothetical protein
MLADAFPERASRQPQTRRRAGTAALVILLHVIVLYGLVQAVYVQVSPQKLIERIPVTIWMPLTPPKKAPEKKKEVTPSQQIDASRVPIMRTAPITMPPTPARPHSTDEDGFGKFGRYLNNCSEGNYSALSKQEWANCLGGYATRGDSPVRIGDVQTLWEQQHPPPPKANPKEAHGFGECAHNDPKRLMGLPCFQHNGDAPSVENGQQ